MNFNSQGTENFPFSYFANPKLKLIKVIKDIKNMNTFYKTRTHGLGFECESFLEKSSHDAVITVFILAQKGKMAFKTPFVPRELILESFERDIFT